MGGVITILNIKFYFCCLAIENHTFFLEGGVFGWIVVSRVVFVFTQIYLCSPQIKCCAGRA